MQTFDDLLKDALLENDGHYWGDADITPFVNDPDDDEIRVSVTYWADRRRTFYGRPQWYEETVTYPLEWDGTENPGHVVAALAANARPDREDAVIGVDVELPRAVALDLIRRYAEIIDDEVYVLGAPELATMTGGVDYAEWNDAMEKLAQGNPGSAPNRDRFGAVKSIKNAGAFIAGVWAGVHLGEALDAATRMDNVLEANGHAPLFVKLTTPQVTGTMDIQDDILETFATIREHLPLLAPNPPHPTREEG